MKRNPKVKWAIWCEKNGTHSLPSCWFGSRGLFFKSRDAAEKRIKSEGGDNSSWRYIAKKYSKRDR